MKWIKITALLTMLFVLCGQGTVRNTVTLPKAIELFIEQATWKRPVRAGSTADIGGTYASTDGTSLRGQFTDMPDTIDGVALAVGDRVLLMHQTNKDENGPWIVTTLGTGADGVWDRTTDGDEDAEIVASVVVYISEGTQNADSAQIIITDNPIVIGGASGTDIDFAELSGGASSPSVFINYFFNHTASDLAGIYYDMTNSDLEGVESTLTTSGLTTGDDQALVNFATLSGEPGITTLSAGVYNVRFTAERSAGGKTVNLYYEIYTRTSGGSETLRGTSEISGEVDSKTPYSLYTVINSDVTILTTDRIIVKFYANVSGSGGDVDVDIVQEGDLDSRLTIPTTSSFYNTLYVRRDGTSGLTDDWDAGAYEIRALTFESDQTTGTAPFTIASTTVVPNLNVDQIDGKDETAFVLIDGSRELSSNWDAGAYTITGTQFHSDIVTGTAPLTVASTTVVANLNVDQMDGLDSTDIVLLDGSQALTSDWDAGGYEIRAQTLESDVTTGTAPFTIASTTVSTNLNADLLDGQTGTYYLDSANFSGTDWTDLTDAGASTLHKHDHGNLDGTGDDDHSQYGLLLGRSGGQTYIGGTGANDDITLQTTSDVSKGSYILSELTTNGGIITTNGSGVLTSSVTLPDGTLATTQSPTDASTKLATTAYVDTVEHHELDGLSDDDHSQYLLLLGRSGGQTAIGGTGAGDDLTLETTSNGSKGSYIFSELTTVNGILRTDGSGVVTSSVTLPDGTLGTTQSASDNSTKIATTAYADTAVAAKDTFVELTDTPANYTSAGLDIVRVNTGTTALEFVDETSDLFSQYALLVGRSGGTTLIGGTGAGDDITLQTTSNGSKGSYILSELTTVGGILRTDGSGVVTSSVALPDGTTATTQSANDNSTKIATTAYVDSGSFIGAGVYNNADLTIPTSTSTPLTFNSERFDTNSIHDTGSNTSRLTAQTGGKYIITGHIEWETAKSTGYRQAFFRLNGSTTLAMSQLNSSAISTNNNQLFLVLSGIYDLSASDYIEIIVRQTEGSNVKVKSTGNRSPEFMMALLK